jgi:aldehyde:ferredoxin oxidoreductase
LCKFLRGVFEEPMPEWSRLLNAVTGWDTDAAELAITAQRIVMTKRLFNVREGWTREEDWLPERFLSEPVALDSGRQATLSAERLESMISSYYRGRGLELTGLPRTETLTELDLVGLGTGSGQIRLSEGD